MVHPYAMTLAADYVRSILDHNPGLIAAAPEMFFALSKMVDRWEPDSNGADRRMYDEAVAAIAKALGKTP